MTYFFIDDNVVENISPKNNWEINSYFINAGSHKFKWLTNANSSHFYIDHVVFLKDAYDNIYEINNENSMTFNVYPNPANDFINIEINNNYDSNFKISIYNSLGIKVIETSNENTINIEDLPSGMYFINVMTEKFSRTEKVMKR